MTQNQKRAIEILIQGGNIVHLGPSGIRVRDKNLNPVLKLKQPTFENLKLGLNILKKHRKLGYIIAPAKILKLHGNNLVKKLYKERVK